MISAVMLNRLEASWDFCKLKAMAVSIPMTVARITGAERPQINA